MNHGQNRMAGEHLVQCYKLRGSRTRCDCWRRIPSGENWAQVSNSADGDGRADEREKNYCAPQRPAGTNSWLHTFTTHSRRAVFQ